tara:strand:- start:189 stop:350 length:162 start_codon:yes stop_codon:yes gene_type:complete
VNALIDRFVFTKKYIAIIPDRRDPIINDNIRKFFEIGTSLMDKYIGMANRNLK